MGALTVARSVRSPVDTGRSVSLPSAPETSAQVAQATSERVRRWSTSRPMVVVPIISTAIAMPRSGSPCSKLWKMKAGSGIAQSRWRDGLVAEVSAPTSARTLAVRKPALTAGST